MRPPEEVVMVAVRAQILSDAPILDQRSAARRTLRLGVPTSTPRDATEALIHNLSETGLLLETCAELEVGEALKVEIPHAGTTTAIIVWTRGKFSGGEFVAPISKAAVSAALLRAPAEATAPPETVRQIVSAPRDEYSPVSEPNPVSRAALVVTLIVGTAFAVLFVLALLTFSFSLS